jgi:four helix bundle protein
MENRKPARSFKDLIVWQKAHRLVLGVYKCTKAFPKDEQYGLTSQIRRSMVSVAANIAEGFKKRSDLDKLRIYNISQGSLAETEYYLLLAKDLEYTDTELLMGDLEEVGRLLEGLMRSIKTIIPNTKY